MGFMYILAHKTCRLKAHGTDLSSTPERESSVVCDSSNTVSVAGKVKLKFL